MNVRSIYQASDADATRALYANLEALGGAGIVAVNLLRAQKASARAKVYSRRYSKLAYEKKDWAIGQLCAALERQCLIGVTWGWKEDPAMAPDAPHRWVLYIELPVTPALAKGPAVLSQVSFHNGRRLTGPDYPHDWDRVVGASEGRIIAWAQGLLDAASERPTTISLSTSYGVNWKPAEAPDATEDPNAYALWTGAMGGIVGAIAGKLQPRRADDEIDTAAQLDLTLDIDNPQEG